MEVGWAEDVYEDWQSDRTKETVIEAHLLIPERRPIVLAQEREKERRKIKAQEKRTRDKERQQAEAQEVANADARRKERDAQRGAGC